MQEQNTLGLNLESQFDSLALPALESNGNPTQTLQQQT